VRFLLELGLQIAEGLHAAHRVGFIHRDVKPSNIWLETSGEWRVASGEERPADSRPAIRVRILDFGLARVVRAGPRLTQSGMIVGTPGFLSPEQAAGRPVDARSDLFSLGVVLYVLATGTMPFTGDDVIALLTALAVEHPRPIFDLNPDLPEPIAHLIIRLLSKQPEKRPASAAEVIDILRVLQTRVRSGETLKLAESLKPARPVAPAWKGRHLAWGIGLAAALLVGLWFLLAPFRQPQDPKDSDPVPATNVPVGSLAKAARDPLPAPERPANYGPQQTMTLNVHVVNIKAWPALEAKIKALADSPKGFCKVRTSGEYKWVDLAPVMADAETFALRITFGRIVAIHNDRRLIYLESGQ
jgi:serine/threonine protein kinase